MERIYKTYKDIAEIHIVYIREAHAADTKTSWPIKFAEEKGINEHTNYGERCAVAERFAKDNELTIPCLIDNMKNDADKAYNGWPDRVYLVRKDGRLAVAGRRGPRGFRPAVKEAEAWLAEYKKTGKEPAIKKPDKTDDKPTEKKDNPDKRAEADSKKAAEKHSGGG